MLRISIHADPAGDVQAHDVAICARTPVAVLLPNLIDMVGVDAGHGVRWQLRGATGACLDDTLSLTDNGVWDGDVVTLDRASAAPHGLLGVEPVRVLAGTGDGPRIARGALIEIGWAWLMLAAALTLTWAGLRSAPIGAAIAVTCCAAATFWRAMAAGSSALAVAAALGSGSAGFVVVPTGPGAPNVLLGAAIVVAASVAADRFIPRSTAALIATGSAAALVAVVAAVAIAGSLTPVTAGAALTVGGIGLLASAPRCAALLAGVQAIHLVEPPPDLPGRATTAHALLTGLVIGSAAAASIGAGLVARAAQTVPTIAFVAVTALLLLVRVRTQVDAARRFGLTGAGLTCATVTLAAVAVAFPAASGWAAVGVIAAAGIATAARPGLTAQRALDGLDHLCATLLIPLACWVIGLYSLARDWVFT